LQVRFFLLNLDLDLDLPFLKRTWTRTWTCPFKVDLDLDLDLDLAVAGLVTSLPVVIDIGLSGLHECQLRLIICSWLQKISRCWPPTKSSQPFKLVRFKTVPRGKIFERLEEVEYYHILHF